MDKSKLFWRYWACACNSCMTSGKTSHSYKDRCGILSVVDYKMKLELNVRTRKIQGDWYGKRGISLHGFLAIAQVSETERRTEVIDLWSEDTKQDAWFSQSAMDVCFRWMEKEFPGFRVYLFSGEYSY